MMARALVRAALRPTVVACLSGAAVVAGPLYTFTQSARLLQAADAKAAATSAHPELPSKLAAIMAEAAWREALSHEFSDVAIDSLLKMPLVQLQAVLWLAWTLPLTSLLVVAAVRRTPQRRALVHSITSLGTALVLLNMAVALSAAWVHGASVERVLHGGLRSCAAHVAMGTAYVTLFGSLHRLTRSSGLKWLAASLGVWASLWFVRMTLRALDSQFQYWLPGGADTQLFGPTPADFVQGLVTCSLWALCASGVLAYIDRQRAGTRPSLHPISKPFQG